MNAIQSPADTSRLLAIVNEHYPIQIDQVNLHRDMIGFVYLAQSGSSRWILKRYRPFDSDNALRSIQIIQNLKANDYPVVSIIPARSGAAHITIDTPQGPSIAVLYEYIAGVEPDLGIEIERVGRQVGWLHRLMKDYPGPLVERGKDFYVDRYIDILRQKRYNPARVEDLAAYGSQLWQRMERLPAGFCHGDLHTGNMFETRPGKYVLFDFDVASRAYPLIDAATLCDGSNFNHFDPAAYDRTLRMFERFYKGYSRESTLTDPEVAAIFDFIPIRHYELIATISQCQGLDTLSGAFLDEQYDWLMRWKNLCDQKA